MINSMAILKRYGFLISAISISSVFPIAGESAEKNIGLMSSEKSDIEILVERHSTRKILDDHDERDFTPELYRSAFLSLLLKGDFSEAQFVEKDWEIIQNLPDHSDSYFLSKDYESIANICQSFFNNSDRSHVKDVSAAFEIASIQSRNRITEHYDTVMNSLSIEGQELIHREVQQIKNRLKISRVEVDWVTISSINPDFVASMYSASCSNNLKMLIISKPQDC